MTTDFGSMGTAAALAFIGFMQIWTKYRQSQTSKTVDKIHTLTNSAMGAQLKLNVEFAEANAVQAHRIAEITKAEGDVAAAIAADVKTKSQQALYQDHVVQQAKVDAQSA